MRKELGLSGRCGFALLAVAVIGLPIATFAGGIDLATFGAVSVVWLLVSAMLILGESITEVTLWKASIKRDVTAAQTARAEAEAIRDQMRQMCRVIVENNYLLSCVSELAKNPGPATQRLTDNINALEAFVEPDAEKATEWRKSVRALFHDPSLYQ
ncbi:hypothetical protein [Pseudomonas boanensis]|uniref:hypothetical protein n=1 Tax=Metapseudomonas boanensis TaxID=2822138 RepID=UPI0035D4E270